MKILAFTPFSTMFGGANRSFLMVLQGLRDRYGCAVTVVVPEEGALTQALDQRRIPWKILPAKKVRGVYGRSFSNALRLVRMSGYVRANARAAAAFADRLDESYDAIYLNDCNPFIGAQVARRLRVAYVWHFRSLVEPDVLYPMGIKTLLQNCDRIIAISQGMEALLRRNRHLPADRIRCVYNGLPVERCNRAQPYTGQTMRMVICGRLAEEKGHKDALEAMKILAEQGIEDLELHIAGASRTPGAREYEERLRRMTAEYGLSNRVFFEGQIEDMPAFREKMNVELVCSVCEPFGRVTVEGMRSGLVVIGSDTGGTREIIRDGESGLLYRQGDPRDLADKIRRVHDDPAFARQLVDQGCAYGMSHFTAEQNVENVFRVLRDAVESRNGEANAEDRRCDDRY